MGEHITDQRRKTIQRILAGLTLLIAFSAGFATHILAQSTSPTYFAACLTARETLSDVVVNTGAPPATPTCRTNETLVQWSDGNFTAGTGLSLSDGVFSINFAGTGTANTVARSDHTHTLADNSVTGAKITNITRAVPASLVNTNVLMSSVGTSVVLYSFIIPDDYAGGDITIREWWQWHDNGGVARLDRRIQRLATSAASATSLGTITHDYTCCDNQRTWSLPASSIAAGDIIFADIVRYGDDSSDTMGRLGLTAVAAEYTADQ